MYIIAIANEKGGVAKTTTTISLGASLAECGFSVLMIDLDTQANLSLAIGIEPGTVRQSSATILLEDAPAKNIVMKTNFGNLDIIPSSNDMGLAERFLPIQPGYEYTLKKALSSAALEYDYVLIDCPPFLGAVTLNALVTSNLLLVPTQAEFFSIYALRNLMGWIRRIRVQYNPQLTYRLLLTMFDRRNRAHRVLWEQLKSTFHNGLLNSRIDTDTKLRESPIAGVPILTHAPKSRAAEQYRALAQEIINYVENTSLQPAE
jgi:chromosome partitioning protein